MKRPFYLTITLTLLAVLAGCQHTPAAPIPETSAAPTYQIAEHRSRIMQHPEEYPSLSEADFLDATEQYLTSGDWNLDHSKAAFHTYGISYAEFLIERNYLFCLHYDTSTKSYSCTLLYFENGAEISQETDPQRFPSFLENY